MVLCLLLHQQRRVRYLARAVSQEPFGRSRLEVRTKPVAERANSANEHHTRNRKTNYRIPIFTIGSYETTEVMEPANFPQALAAVEEPNPQVAGDKRHLGMISAKNLSL